MMGNDPDWLRRHLDDVRNDRVPPFAPERRARRFGSLLVTGSALAGASVGLAVGYFLGSWSAAVVWGLIGMWTPPYIIQSIFRFRGPTDPRW